MRKRIQEIQARLQQILLTNPDRVWRIGALYDELVKTGVASLSLRKIEKAMMELVAQRQVAVSWEIYNTASYRLISS